MNFARVLTFLMHASLLYLKNPIKPPKSRFLDFFEWIFQLPALRLGLPKRDPNRFAHSHYTLRSKLGFVLHGLHSAHSLFIFPNLSSVAWAA